ncbi:TMEM175 family protein [Actinoplanes solisilvae]|uniref:TMEM175 family protein n=1 Tax=Actinoplanes solisilvae TaxID=2486853 RepID=UPI0013E31E31|nr:TMEM175 family protein [Actinoplanes solisilvae]
MDETSTKTSSERLVSFTDAVAAIAMTLLVLPLLDDISELTDDRPPLGELISEHRAEFGAFLLSFAVIYRLWWAHHRLFSHLPLIRTPMVILSALWTLSIVFLPIPTGIITAYPASPGTVALYGGTLTLATGCLTLLSWYGRRHPALSGDRSVVPPDYTLGNFTAFLGQLLATAVGAAFSDTIGFYAFLLQFLTPLLERPLRNRGPFS